MYGTRDLGLIRRAIDRITLDVVLTRQLADSVSGEQHGRARAYLHGHADGLEKAVQILKHYRKVKR